MLLSTKKIMSNKKIIIYIIFILFVIVLIILLQKYRECENRTEITKAINPCKFWSFN